MPLDRLVERILRDARESAAKIVGDARAKRAEMLGVADDEAEARYNSIVNRERRVAEAAKKQSVTMAGLEGRKEVLVEKQSLIAEAFDRAVRSFAELPDGEYAALMATWLAATGREEGELIMSPDDRQRVGGDIIAAANAELEKRGSRGRIDLSPDTRDIAGGFILSSGGIEMNYSLDALIHSRREELEPRIIQALFKEGSQDA
jgi:V/A-type H+-transporting ATPase subunit E